MLLLKLVSGSCLQVLSTSIFGLSCLSLDFVVLFPGTFPIDFKVIMKIFELEPSSFLSISFSSSSPHLYKDFHSRSQPTR